MNITTLINKLTEVLKQHGDLPVTAHCIDDELTKVTVLQETSEVWEEGTEAVEVFLEG